MSFTDSILVAVFSIALVFFVLISLYVLIEIFSKVLAAVQGKPGKASIEARQTETTQTIGQPVAAPEITGGPELSTGELKLKKVDEKTAAMIMAIVSHESDIPLSELRFKSIKAIEE